MYLAQDIESDRLFALKKIRCPLPESVRAALKGSFLIFQLRSKHSRSFSLGTACRGGSFSQISSSQYHKMFR